MRLTCLLLLSLIAPSSATAIVVRHDTDDAEYRVDAVTFPALVDLPGEGHGVLIDRQWVVTAAHTLPRHGELEQVAINGKPRPVARVVVHPGYRTPPDSLFEQAMATGEAVLILALIAAADDIALIELAEPVSDIAPVARYPDATEYGKVIQIVGKGATGTGAAGHDPKGPNRTTLRRAYNTVTSAHERWFCYVFDEPPQAQPLEGIGGNGDSGSPALIEVDGTWTLAGLASWKLLTGDVRTARPGRYGQVSCNVRLSHYRAWIDGVVSGRP
ncbi:MAG: trypsin-like serine protease [Xanthomonadaceae bacterium]|jgi:hypothetical protein|nr:trypsin-like serine protease [Xanthomonadaceae bacterium]